MVTYFLLATIFVSLIRFGYHCFEGTVRTDDGVAGWIIGLTMDACLAAWAAHLLLERVAQ